MMFVNLKKILTFKRVLNCKNYIHFGLCLFLAIVLMFSPFLYSYDCFNQVNFNNNLAFADDVENAKVTLQSAQEELNSVKAEYEEANAKAEDLRSQINDCANNAIEAQNQKIHQQDSLKKIAVYEYRNGCVLPYLKLIFDSQNFDDFLKNMFYANSIMQEKTKSIEQHNKVKEDYENSLTQLNSVLDDYDQTLSLANEKLNRAEQVVNDAYSQLKNAEEIEKLKSQAAEIKNVPAKDSETPGSDPVPAGEWKSGSASAYGGSSDPGTSSRTATGAAITENSTGVSVPISMPGYRSLFGHAVQIKLNGTIVMGVINDCGSLAGGSRVLDVQPGIFHSFGFSTCQDWGVQYIEYRIL